MWVLFFNFSRDKLNTLTTGLEVIKWFILYKKFGNFYWSCFRDFYSSINDNSFDCVLVFLLLDDNLGPYVQSVIFNIVELINIKSNEAIIGIVLFILSGLIVQRLKIQDLSIETF